MIARRSRLPWVWIIGTLGAVVLGLTGLGLWQKQLPHRLKRAAERGDLAACLRLGRQLGALQPLQPSQAALLENCLQRRAQRSWDGGLWWAALDQQRQLVRRSGNPAKADFQLQQWRDQLRTKVLQRFLRGELAQALSLISSSGENRFPEGQDLQDSIKENWAANRFQLEQAQQKIGQRQWWEALNHLNQLNHPWWIQQAQNQRLKVEQQVKALAEKKQQQNSHAGVPSGGGPDAAALDARILQLVAAGKTDWAAFQAACRELGGEVREEGPESSCQGRMRR
ncbi:MAG: hypothetical protein EBR68_00395 [Synechococcaceae bacterium WB4_2_0811]|jgi:hypothetical protein|nr:hypothetical protein [Synechococcaceae bacterium WB4_2_0811]